MRTQTSEAAVQPHAYNAAFDELDLTGWRWDPATHGSGREGLRAYVEKEHPHLLRVYDADFLFQAVEATRARLESSR